MIFRLALAEIRNRPGRAAFLLAGYALGVSVMVVLLAVGEAMLTQSRDKQLIGGGDVVVVPAGVSTEMLKAGGIASLFLGIDHARFIQRNLLESPRARSEHGFRAASPIIDGAQVEVTARGAAWKAVAGGEIPSRAAAAGARPRLLAGRWEDDAGDQLWAAPTQDELFREIDHFHQPRGATARDSTWAEWHYFNLVLDEHRWVYVTLLVGGRVGEPGRWGGRVLITIRDPDGVHRSLTADARDTQVRFDTLSPDLTIGGSYVRQADGAYRVLASAGAARVDVTLRPAARRYFPPTDIGGSTLVSGYVAPALYATADGTVCLPRCEAVRGAQAYHDHNWGVWRSVSWEWGSASDARMSLLYGVVRGDSTATEGMFAYLVDGMGVRGVFRPGAMRVTRSQPLAEGAARLTVPKQFTFADTRRGLSVTVDVAAAHATDQHRPRRRWFIQMRGTATVSENGRVVGRLPGFFETYVD